MGRVAAWVSPPGFGLGLDSYGHGQRFEEVNSFKLLTCQKKLAFSCIIIISKKVDFISQSLLQLSIKAVIIISRKVV